MVQISMRLDQSSGRSQSQSGNQSNSSPEAAGKPGLALGKMAPCVNLYFGAPLPPKLAVLLQEEAGRQGRGPQFGRDVEWHGAARSGWAGTAAAVQEAGGLEQASFHPYMSSLAPLERGL